MNADEQVSADFEGAQELAAQNQVVAAMLREMLKLGVKRTEWGTEDFSVAMADAGYAEFEHDSLFNDLMLWLQAEGIIRFSSSYDDGVGGSNYCDCVLTGHGMNVLQTRSSILGGRTPAQALMDRDTGAQAGQYVRLGGLLGGVIGGFTKSIS
jgi:hypothetical protein